MATSFSLFFGAVLVYFHVCDVLHGIFVFFFPPHPTTTPPFFSSFGRDSFFPFSAAIPPPKIGRRRYVFLTPFFSLDFPFMRFLKLGGDVSEF